jgi:hypothetical protein
VVVALIVGATAITVLVGGCGDDSGNGGETVEQLFSPTGNRLDVYDIETGAMSTLIPAEQNTVNGQACLLPDGDGRFLMGEDTNQENGDRQGWGIFLPDGTFERKILEPESANEPEQIEPYGCGFDAEERLFTTDVGSGDFDSTDGKLIIFFPPDYETACVLATDIKVAGGIAIDDEGYVYVPETVPPGHVLRWGPDFPSNADECDSVQPERTVFIEDPDMGTPMGIVRAPNGNWYVSSVFVPPTVREYDADGNFVRVIAEGDDIGNPAGISIGADGTLFYADLGLVQEPGELPGPGDGTGTVRKITFDADGNPQSPVIMGEGLDYPDAVSVLEVEAPPAEE